MDWFIYDTGLRLERVKVLMKKKTEVEIISNRHTNYPLNAAHKDDDTRAFVPLLTYLLILKPLYHIYHVIVPGAVLPFGRSIS